MGYNKKMQMGGNDGPTRVRYGSRKTARKARRAVRRGETPPDPNAMPTPKPKGVVKLNKALRSPFKGGVKKSSTNPNFIEPNKELKFGGPGKYQTAGPKRERAKIDEDVYTGVNGSRRRTPATSSDPVSGMSPRQRAQNTPQGSSQKTKQGESVYTESTMDRIGRATVPPGSKQGDGKSTTSKVLDKLGKTGGGGKSTQGGKATKIETGVKPRSETTKTEAKKTSGTSSFGKAFAAARKEGKFTFKWNGKSYGTRRSEETIEQHRAAMKKAGGDTPTKTSTKTETKKTETKSTPSSTPKTKTKTESKTETTTPKAETKTPTTPPDRRSMKSKAKETRKDLRGQIKEARKQKRTKKAVKRQGKRVGKLQEKLAKLKSMKTGGGMMKYKPGGKR